MLCVVFSDIILICGIHSMHSVYSTSHITFVAAISCGLSFTFSNGILRLKRNSGLKCSIFAFWVCVVFFKMSFLTLKIFCVFSSKSVVVFNSYIHIYNSSGIDFFSLVWQYQEGGPILFIFLHKHQLSRYRLLFFLKSLFVVLLFLYYPLCHRLIVHRYLGLSLGTVCSASWICFLFLLTLHSPN